jgi:predicted nicotinamide N-methyase
MLWPAAIALAHELAQRPLAGARVLELGAGTGLPGIVAATLGARVVQAERQRVALHVCKLNAERNGVGVEHREADWSAWDDAGAYDLILASDVLYAAGAQPHLRRIFEQNLAPGGAVLVSDPFRKSSVEFLEALEAGGWRVSMTRWTIEGRPIGVFEVTRR